MDTARKKSGYEWIKATITDGSVTFTYQVPDLSTPGRMGHDENVSTWSDDDIRSLGCSLLDIDESCATEIEILWD